MLGTGSLCNESAAAASRSIQWMASTNDHHIGLSLLQALHSTAMCPLTVTHHRHAIERHPAPVSLQYIHDISYNASNILKYIALLGHMANAYQHIFNTAQHCSTMLMHL